MRPTPRSPLHPCVLDESGQIPAYQALGLITELAISHSDYSDLTVELLLERALPALESGQAKLFFDEQQRPYGYASWSMLHENTHRSLLENPSKAAIRPDTFHYTNKGHHLWFFDLLCLFSTPLTILRTLKREMSDHEVAHLIQRKTKESSAVRRIW